MVRDAVKRQKKFKLWGTLVTLKTGRNACFCSDSKKLTTKLFSRNTKIRIYRTMILPVCVVLWPSLTK